MTLSFEASCLHPPNAQIAGMCLHTWLVQSWGIKPGTSCMLQKQLHPLSYIPNPMDYFQSEQKKKMILKKWLAARNGS